jgi:hypothetical protein
MFTASPMRSPCEIIRKINDKFQGDSEQEVEIRKLCAEAERGSKQLAKELNKYKKNAWLGWWAINSTYKADIDRRLNENYKAER